MGLLAVGAAGCGARGHGRGADPDAGVGAGPDAIVIGTGVPDPGSQPPRCSAEEAGLEFAVIWNFESNKGDNMYVYTDRSTPNFTPKGYAPAAVATDRCDASHYAMRIAGGPFRGWGGGVGIGFSNLRPDKCPGGCPGIAGDYHDAVMDVSQWEGISFWGRRGPNGQAAVRVGLGDLHTDDDVSFLMYAKDPTQPRFCERNRECGCTDMARGCSPYDPGAPAVVRNYCWNPDSDPVPTMTRSELNDEYSYPTCAKTKCDEPYPAYNRLDDRAFLDKPCTPYAFPNGTYGEFCYDPATDPPPFDNTQVCGDHWVFPVTLTPDWHLYLVPFTALQQQGFGKKFAKPDLTAVSMMRFMWDVGWVDTWIDDVAFYRTRK